MTDLQDQIALLEERGNEAELLSHRRPIPGRGRTTGGSRMSYANSHRWSAARGERYA